MLVLGIETSCDETAAAVVRDDGLVLSDVVHSQIALHAPYGGVVPELASRDHMRNIRHVLLRAMQQSNAEFSDIAGICVTCRPGLSGALLVGLQMARGLAWALDKPVVGVDHLVGHLMAVFLQYDATPTHSPAFPFVALIVSGGHTALYRVDGVELWQMRELGATRDDAAGEAFDKVAKLLGLGYPGGPVIDRLARQGDRSRIDFSRPMPSRNSFEFSFSGLKTNVMRHVIDHGLPRSMQELQHLCASFQFRVVEALVRKSLRAVRAEGLNTLVVGGGVAANFELRRALKIDCEKHEIRLFLPPLRACTDNAAMIAYAGSHRIGRAESDGDSLVMSPHTALNSVTRKGPGRRTRSRQRLQIASGPCRPGRCLEEGSTVQAGNERMIQDDSNNGEQ